MYNSWYNIYSTREVNALKSQGTQVQATIPIRRTPIEIISIFVSVTMSGCTF